MKKKILLTGTTGFIGKLFLKNLLTRNIEVLDIVRKKNIKNKDLILLKKKYPKKYKTLFYSKYDDLKILKNYKFDYFINFATLYKNNHHYNEIPKFIDSNITFPSVLFELIHKRTKKIINFGTMMQHSLNSDYLPKNFYASTKSAFEMISKYYEQKIRNLKIYNIKFYESFHEADYRKKLIPTLIHNYKKNSITKILSNKLELNIIHVEDLFQAIFILLKTNLNSGNFQLLNRKNINIYKLINKINSNNVKKIKVQFLTSKNMLKPKTKTLNLIPKWKQKSDLENKIIEAFN